MKPEDEPLLEKCLQFPGLVCLIDSFAFIPGTMGEVFNTLTDNRLTVVSNIYLKFNLCISSDTKKGSDLKFPFKCVRES